MPRRAALALAAATLTLSACGKPAVEARPALWRVQDADTTIWLIGTVHVLPPEVNWRTPAIEAAIDGADTLVTEIADGGAPPAMQPDAHLAPIEHRLPAGRKAALDKAIAAAGTTPAALDGLKSWAAATALAEGPVRAAGASKLYGVEAVLGARFTHKRHLAFETAAGEIALFDALPEAAQRVLLLRAVDGRDDYRATLAAWAAGDQARLAARFEPAFRDAPVLQQWLVRDRNARWSRWIAARMRMPGKVLIAVGAGHLTGHDSVIAMLRARAMTVTRVQ